MDFSIVKQDAGFVLQMGSMGTMYFTLDDAKRAAAAFLEAVEWASKEVPLPPLGPKDWSPRGRQAIPGGPR